MLHDSDLLGLDRLLEPLLPHPDRGLGATASSSVPRLHVPVGIGPDDTVCRADLRGHTLVTGPPGSGRSSTIAVLMAALALTRTPDEVQFHCLATGPGPADLAGLPHVGTVIAPDDRAAVIGLLQQLSTRPHPDTEIYLVIDCPAQLSALGPELIATADAAPGREAHLLVAADSEAQVPDGLRTWFTTHVDLEGSVGGRVTGPDGRATPFTPVAARIGLPSTVDGAVDGADGADDADDAVAARRRLAATVDEYWQPRAGAPTLVNPTSSVRPSALPTASTTLQVPLGAGPGRPAPVLHDFARHRALIVRGPKASGRTTLLRSIAEELVRGRTPAQVRLLLVDYRAGLMECVAEDFLLGHAFHANALRDLIDGTLWALAGRRQGPGGQNSTEWRGPRLYVLVDDHVHAPDDEDIWSPVLEHLGGEQDAGVHLVLAEAVDQPAPTEDDVSSITLSEALLDIGAATVDLPEPGSDVPVATYRADGRTTGFTWIY
ncbi:FtsK/SpoIIIE domain-containing protein [Kineosporia sp. NBRC 101731]|uniref:FtsK/SpoIIIE domain-containing protein n=1 Tax=Kineosporia sp. NBRC 101731 TaxID=3032199 RepID=UPI00249FA312|nr:FtsK/SpoIIIE domain-containing protein [Kineosporia sp. NBRC 101731]GLY28926.1 hypothetical protein Kisp02_22910 [Kineosporia sp. NBRC 101731]